MNKEIPTINYEGLISECLDIIGRINKKTYLLQSNNCVKECHPEQSYETILYSQLCNLRERLIDLDISIVP